ncbi:MAG: Lin0512 family protein [Candidatus Bathyarchaeia archaeon]
MNLKTFTIEMGTGIDMHGLDVTKASKRAVRDAISHQQMRGLGEIVGLRRENRDALHVEVTIATPYPERVNAKEVLDDLAHIPERNKSIKVVEGGMLVPVDKDPPVVAVASVIVLVDMDRL